MRGALISQSHSGSGRGRPALIVVQILSGAVFFKQLDCRALVAHIAAHCAGARAGCGGEQRGGRSRELVHYFIVLFKRTHHSLRFPLRPSEVVVLPFLVLDNAPPPSRLKRHSHENRVVSASYVRLVR